MRRVHIIKWCVPHFGTFWEFFFNVFYSSFDYKFHVWKRNCLFSSLLIVSIRIFYISNISNWCKECKSWWDYQANPQVNFLVFFRKTKICKYKMRFSTVSNINLTSSIFVLENTLQMFVTYTNFGETICRTKVFHLVISWLRVYVCNKMHQYKNPVLHWLKQSWTSCGSNWRHRPLISNLYVAPNKNWKSSKI